MSGNICAATNSPSPCSKATTISSTNPAPHGTSSPTIPNASPQSHPELGRRSILEAVGISHGVLRGATLPSEPDERGRGATILLMFQKAELACLLAEASVYRKRYPSLSSDRSPSPALEEDWRTL